MMTVYPKFVVFRHEQRPWELPTWIAVSDLHREAVPFSGFTTDWASWVLIEGSSHIRTLINASLLARRWFFLFQRCLAKSRAVRPSVSKAKGTSGMYNGPLMNALHGQSEKLVALDDHLDMVCQNRSRSMDERRHHTWPCIRPRTLQQRAKSFQRHRLWHSPEPARHEFECPPRVVMHC